jgi:hypothetical protein
MDRTESPVALANRSVSFPVACAWAGIDVPGDVPEGGWKTYCPFGEWAHEDGGAQPAFRVYRDHGYCFAEAERFSPVRLCALAWDCTQEEAAREMLARSGVADPDYREQWKRLVDYRQPVDVDGLARLLRTWCARTSPRWAVRQYDKTVADKFAGCLKLLALVRDEADCRAWLAGCKKVMAQVLGEGERDAGEG